MRRAWIAVMCSTLLTAGGCRRQAQAPPAVSPPPGPLYTWAVSDRTVPAGTLVVIRTFETIDTAEAQRIFPAMVARDTPNAAGRPVVLGGSPATLIVLTGPAGGYRLGLHSVVAGGNTYLTSPAGRDARAGVPAERGAPLGTLVDTVPAGGTAQTAPPVSVEGTRIFVPSAMLLFFRLQQPIQFE
jgi:hypothetical protein